MYRGGLARISEINWLDPLRTGSPGPFHRPDIFARPTAAELALGWANMGGVRIVNCLNPAQTGFPSISLEEIKELCGGPYLLKLAKSYLTSYRVRVVQNQPYVNLLQYHNDRRQPNLHMLGYIFDQQLPPLNWHGVWPGCQSPNTKLWEPVRFVVLPRLPSRYRSNCDHTVVVAYVPANLPVMSPTPGFNSPSLHRIKMWICGPRYQYCI